MRRAALAVILSIIASGCVSKREYARDIATLAIGLKAQNELNMAIASALAAQETRMNIDKEEAGDRFYSINDKIGRLTRTFDDRLLAVEKSMTVKVKFGKKPIKPAGIGATK